MTGSAWASGDGAAGSSTNVAREMVTIHASSPEDEADNDQLLQSATDAGSSASAGPYHSVAGRSFYPQLPSTLGANDGADDCTASRSSFSLSWNDGRHLQLDAMDWLLLLVIGLQEGIHQHDEAATE